MHGIIQDCTSYVHNVRRGGGYLSIMVATSNTYMYMYVHTSEHYTYTHAYVLPQHFKKSLTWCNTVGGGGG